VSKPSEEISELLYGNEVARLELELEKARNRANAKATALRHAVRELEQLQQALGVQEGLLTATPNPPKWLQPGKGKASKRATVCTMLSDTHFDEVVNPDEVNHLNAYNREIASARLRRYFNRVISIPRDHFAGPEYSGVVVFMGGDMISGDIHDELVQTNEDTVLGTLLYWSEQLAAGFEMLADFYPAVHVVSVCGNHGRRTRKERAKLRARDSFDWLLSHMTKRACSNKKITWDIPEEADARVTVQNTRYLLTHGNLGFSGGNGIGGAWTAIMRGDIRRRQREAFGGQPYDVLLAGHYHTYRLGNEFVINGSMKGVDEYAYVNSFGLEVPKQALWLETPAFGAFAHTPIFCAPMTDDGIVDRKAEGW
jgi:predicted phosphodiesterase